MRLFSCIASSIVAVGTVLSWGQMAQAQPCKLNAWITNTCPPKGFKIGGSDLPKAVKASYKLSMVRRMNVVIAQYNANFPILYAQWERNQHIAANRKTLLVKR